MASRGGQGERRWVGASAMHGNDADPERWVIWGTGPTPEETFVSEPGDEIARGIVKGADPDWNDAEGWILVVTTDETAVDELAAENTLVRGHAPYLAAGRHDEVPDRPMRGVLRSDVGPRRKVDQPRPS